MRCEPLGEHFIHWVRAVFLHIAQKMKQDLYILTRFIHTTLSECNKLM